MLTPEQCRAARGWLGWTQEHLAKRAGVGLSTLRAFEAGNRAPMRNNLVALRRELETAGIELVIEGGVPVGIKARAAQPLTQAAPPPTSSASS